MEENIYKTKFKQVTRIVYFSFFVGLLNLIIKLFDIKVEEKPYNYSNEQWDIGVVRKLNLGQVQPEIRGLLQNMGVTNENQVIFGFIAKKDTPEHEWRERIFKEESLNMNKVVIPEFPKAGN